MRPQKASRSELAFQGRKRRAHEELASIVEHELDIISRRGDGEHLIETHARQFRAVANVESQRLSRLIDQHLLTQKVRDQTQRGDEQHIAERVLGEFIEEMRNEGAETIVRAPEPVDECAQANEADDMGEGKEQRRRNMDQQSPAGPHVERRDAISDPNDPQKEDESQPACPLPDDGSDQAELRLLMPRGDDIDRANGAGHDHSAHIAVEEHATRDAARPERLAADPKSPPAVTEAARAITRLFLGRSPSGITGSFSRYREARSHLWLR